MLSAGFQEISGISVEITSVAMATPTHTLLTTLGIFATRAVDSSAWSFPERFIGPGSMGENPLNPQKEMTRLPGNITGWQNMRSAWREVGSSTAPARAQSPFNVKLKTTMKQSISSLGAFGLLSSIALAGSTVPDMAAPAPVASSDGFAQARRPISNPTLFDLALPTTNVHPIFFYHSLPDQINTTLGQVDVGGHVELYALQAEFAINDRLSIVATKDGFVEMRPDSTLSKESGWANLGAGVKYAFILDPVAQTALSGSMTFEVPTGNSDVFQGEGDGAVNLLVSGLKLIDNWQFAGGLGFQIPFSDEQSTEGWMSAHVSYEVCKWFIPLVEVNWFHVLDAGNGSGNYPSQLPTVPGGVPAVVEFEGPDVFNIGAENANENRDFVSAAFGFRSRITDCVDVGAAYEIPLTNEKDGLMESRVTVDLVWKF